MARKTEIRNILENTLTVNQDGVIKGIGEASDIIDQKVDEYIVEEKEFEQISDPETGLGEELL